MTQSSRNCQDLKNMLWTQISFKKELLLQENLSQIRMQEKIKSPITGSTNTMVEKIASHL